MLLLEQEKAGSWAFSILTRLKNLRFKFYIDEKSTKLKSLRVVALNEKQQSMRKQPSKKISTDTKEPAGNTPPVCYS